MDCPFCGLDPYEYADVGIRLVPVGFNCCEDGRLYFVEGWSYRKVKLHQWYSRAWHQFYLAKYHIGAAIRSTYNAIAGKEPESDDIPW